MQTLKHVNFLSLDNNFTSNAIITWWQIYIFAKFINRVCRAVLVVSVTEAVLWNMKEILSIFIYHI